MRKNILKIISIMIVGTILAACGNSDSKVDQVIQSQMQEEDVKISNEEVVEALAALEENDEIEIEVEVEAEVEAEVTPEPVEDNTNLSLPDDNQLSDSESDSDVDIDLTKLSSTMVYSEVYNMMYTPSEYVGQTVRMSGQFVIYTNQDQSLFYPAVIIADATACCSQGLEFLLEGNPPYPEGYPELDTEITVTGTFETYYEDENMFCRLQNAKLE